MLPSSNKLSAPLVISESPFPLGPFPRHIWIHNNTPQDSLDEACHEIWKRVQRLSEELQSPSLVPLLQQALCSDLPGTLQRDATDSQIDNYLPDEPEGLASIYRAMLGNKEREMKLKALCDAHLSAKSVLTSLMDSPESPKNSKGLGDGSMTDTCSKLEMPFPLQYTDAAQGADNQVMAGERWVMKESIQNSNFISANMSTASSATTAESQATGQKQQISPFANICSKTDSNVATKNSVTAAKTDKSVNTSTSAFSTTSVPTALNQTVWQSLGFPPFSIFTNHSNFPQFQGLDQRPRTPYQQALLSSFGCYPRQVPLYSPQQLFQPLHPAMSNFITPVRPVFPLYPFYPAASQNPTSIAGDGMQYPFSPSYGFGSAPGGAVMTNLNCFSNESYAKF